MNSGLCEDIVTGFVVEGEPGMFLNASRTRYERLDIADAFVHNMRLLAGDTRWENQGKVVRNAAYNRVTKETTIGSICTTPAQFLKDVESVHQKTLSANA